MTSFKKDQDTVSDYVRKFKETCDGLVAIGRPVLDNAEFFGFYKGLRMT